MGILIDTLKNFFIHDVTERPIERPVLPDEQSFVYSGNAHDHTLKYMILQNDRKQVIYTSSAYDGAVHDKTIADSEAYVFPDGSIVTQDRGFQGYTPPRIRIIQPKKKPRNNELTDDERDENRFIMSFRVTIEHSIAGIKRFRIVKDRYRLKAHNIHNLTMYISVGLYNLMVHHRRWSCFIL